MRLLADKVFLRITNDNRESIYSKEITRNDGSKTRLFINVSADPMDERHNSLFVSTAIVEAVADSVKHIKVGDTALIDYTLCNDPSKLVYKDEKGEVYWTNANTTYHKEALIANQTQRSRRDQIVYSAGDIENISSIIGIIRDGILTANDPYVFLEHHSTVKSIITLGGIYMDKKETIFDRRVLAISENSAERTGISTGDIVKVNDPDIFLVKYDKYKVDCINDTDCLCLQKTNNELRAV